MASTVLRAETRPPTMGAQTKTAMLRIGPIYEMDKKATLKIQQDCHSFAQAAITT